LPLKKMEQVTLLSVHIDNVTYDDAIARVETFLREPGVHQIATVNPEFVVMAQSNPEFMRVLNSTALNVPDGVGLMWAARRQKTPLRARIAGQDLMDRICTLAAERSEKIFLLGAREGVAEKAANALKIRDSRLEIAGCYAGSPGVEQDEEGTKRLNDYRLKSVGLLTTESGSSG